MKVNSLFMSETKNPAKDLAVRAFEQGLADKNIPRPKALRKLGVVSQTYNHWRTRGFPKDTVFDAAAIINCDPLALKKGEYSPLADNSRPTLDTASEKINDVNHRALARLYADAKKAADALEKESGITVSPDDIGDAVETVITLFGYDTTRAVDKFIELFRFRFRNEPS